MVKKQTPIEPGQNREKIGRILAAARERIRQFGFSKVTMDDLAADLGLVKGALYYYFPTKESLFKAVIKDEEQEFIAAAQEVLARALPAAEKLRLYILLRLRYFRELLNFSVIDPHSWNSLTLALKDMYGGFEQIEIDFLEQILLEGRRSGEFCVPHRQQMAELLLHVLRGLRLRAVRAQPQLHLDDAAYAALENEMQLLTGLILFGLKGDDEKGTNNGRCRATTTPSHSAGSADRRRTDTGKRQAR